MTSSHGQTNDPQHAELPHYQVLLDSTDWASLETPSGTGAFLPEALARLVDADPAVRVAAIADALGGVTHQNTIYEATVPVALYVAAILDHPAAASGDCERDAEGAGRYPTRAALLEWLSNTAYDADDECVAIGERIWGGGYLDDYSDMRAFRDLRPALFSAVRPLLSHDDESVREAALIAAIPLVEHPALKPNRDELVDHARRLLAASSDRYKRDRVLDALKAWGHDTRALENPDDRAARERYARLKAERESRASDWLGGYAKDPPF
ncbi:hypothetical protein [Streptomyces sp. NPDC059909]|uniref:hypothetical protein n=1 Tax=Streptomyces sp. NPDC059909 TaxID=3346998 RepID=UPI003655CBEA